MEMFPKPFLKTYPKSSSHYFFISQFWRVRTSSLRIVEDSLQDWIQNEMKCAILQSRTITSSA